MLRICACILQHFLQHLCKLSHTWLVQSHLARGFAELRASGVNALSRISISKAGWNVCKWNLGRSRTEVSQAESAKAKVLARSAGAGLGVMGRKVAQPHLFSCLLYPLCCDIFKFSLCAEQDVKSWRWQVYPKARERLCLRTNFHFGLLQKNLENQTKFRNLRW